MKRFEVPEGYVLKAYKFALNPNASQMQDIARHFGARRFAFNWGLAQVKADSDAKEANPDHPSVGWSFFDLTKAFNSVKPEVAPWSGEVSKFAFESGLKDLAAGLANHQASKKGVRKGPKMGFPRFKKRSADRGRVTFRASSTTRIDPDRRHVVLPTLGRVRSHRNMRCLERLTRDGRARILSATLSERAGKIFVSFQCLVRLSGYERVPTGPVVGIDLGLGDVLAVAATEDGAEVARLANPRALRRAQSQLRAANRRKARRVPGSAGYQRAKREISRIYARVADVRAHHQHVFTSAVAKTHSAVVVEDLNVKAMAARKGYRLGKSVGDAGMGELRRQLSYKAARVVVADRWFPSTQICSVCGERNRELSLGDRKWRCSGCGTLHDRDLNAATNLAKLARLEPGVEPTVRPDLVRLVALKREGEDLSLPNLERGAMNSSSQIECPISSRCNGV